MLAKPITATVWSVPGARLGASPRPSASSSRSTSRMSEGRCSRSFCSIRSESVPSPAASRSRALGGSGSRVRIASTSSTMFAPANGRRPHSIS
jgi:hypothetical protein